MRIGVVGGGPAGLYFALLMKKRNPSHAIRVVEQNPAGATYGWGVVFSDRALSFLEDADRASHADVERRLETWEDQAIVHRGEAVRIDGIGFSGIARLELLGILQEHCRRASVELRFEQQAVDLAALADCDLIVGADGANSVVRQVYQEHFRPAVEVLTNKYVWYGTSRLFDCLTLTFRQNADGAFVAHHYRYSEDRGTFIVECDLATWERAGLAAMSEDESRRYCEGVFKDDLDGHPLLTNRSLWLNFRAVTSRAWRYRNVVLIGDALRTVHFSVGSGTRMALQDAIALADAFEGQPDVEAGLRRFEETRRPAVEEFLRVAAESFRWYERFRDKLHLDSLPFAYDYLLRGGRISHDRLKARSPRFGAAYEEYRAARRESPLTRA